MRRVAHARRRRRSVSAKFEVGQEVVWTHSVGFPRLVLIIVGDSDQYEVERHDGSRELVWTAYVDDAYELRGANGATGLDRRK